MTSYPPGYSSGGIRSYYQIRRWAMLFYYVEAKDWEHSTKGLLDMDGSFDE